jgi:hypothetical protein
VRRDELAKENAKVVPFAYQLLATYIFSVATLDSCNEKLKFSAKLGTTLVTVFTTGHQKIKGITGVKLLTGLGNHVVDVTMVRPPKGGSSPYLVPHRIKSL